MSNQLNLGNFVTANYVNCLVQSHNNSGTLQESRSVFASQPQIIDIFHISGGLYALWFVLVSYLRGLNSELW